MRRHKDMFHLAQQSSCSTIVRIAVHMEPGGDPLSVQIRIEGLLVELAPPTMTGKRRFDQVEEEKEGYVNRRRFGKY